MTRKVIIDCDPGIDAAVALTMALFHPELEVVAVTAVEGCVPAGQATANVQAVIERLDPPRFPRVGAAAAPDARPRLPAASLHGADGLGNCDFAVSQLHHQHPSDKIICDEVRAAPDEISIVCLGPLTNVARAFRRDPTLESIVDRVIMMGGSVNGVGDVTPAAEFNIYFDPVSAHEVFHSRITRLLVPLDVTTQVVFGFPFVETLPPESTRAGSLLRKVLSYYYRAFHQQLGQEGVHLHDAVALLAMTAPDLFKTDYFGGEVETRGEFTTGATVFDRRVKTEWRGNMEVAIEVDAAEVVKHMTQELQRAGRQT